MLPEECNNSGPLSSDLFGKCAFWPCHSLSFPFYLIPHSLSLYIHILLFWLPCCCSFALTPSRPGPLLSLLRPSWVPTLAPCSQLISMTILNFSQLLNFLAIHLPTLAILCFLSPAVPLPHSEFGSAFVPAWIIPYGLLPWALCYLDIVKSNTWNARKSLCSHSVAWHCRRKLIIRRSNCRRWSGQSLHRVEKMVCVRSLWRTGLPDSTSLMLAGVKWYLFI